MTPLERIEAAWQRIRCRIFYAFTGGERCFALSLIGAKANGEAS